jgi:archaetidylinositol phosphate synthase
MDEQADGNQVTLAPPKTYVHTVARWMMKPLVGTPVTPNHITTLRLLSGVMAAWCFSNTGNIWQAWGGIIFIFSMLMDRADGELARMTMQSSRWGHWYDLVCDMFVNMVLFMGIGYGLSDLTWMGEWSTLLGAMVGISIGAIFIIVFQFHINGTHPGVVFMYPDGFDLDDSMFVIPLFAWFDGMLYLLIIAGIVAPAFLIYSIWVAVRMNVNKKD